MAGGLAEKRGSGRGIKDRNVSHLAGIRRHKINLGDRYFYEDFKGRPLCAKANGAGAATGTAADVNLLYTGKNLFEYAIIGTQTVVAPVIGTTGLDIKMDDGAAGGDGISLSTGIVAANARLAFTVGTDAFYLKLKASITDVSGWTTFLAGFRIAAALAADFNDYTDLAGLNVKSGTINIETILNNAATTETSTTQTVADAGTVTLGVFVDKGGNARYEINGAAPTVTAAFQFDSGDVLVPFLQTVDHTDTPGVTELLEFECGLLDANVR